MPTPYPFGRHAILTPTTQTAFQETQAGLLAQTQPGTFLESFLADEMLHASWELQRARIIEDRTETVDILHAATNRATRNFQRAFTELRRLQTARSSRREQTDPPLSDQTSVYPPTVTDEMCSYGAVQLPTEIFAKIV
ncbi:MAG: hypothetical protein FJW30_22425 [Acidobacteria bacterium]|nr:hypothetical protein [Acidobacteriota bacterium]